VNVEAEPLFGTISRPERQLLQQCAVEQWKLFLPRGAWPTLQESEPYFGNNVSADDGGS
jgi:hypothetical protein